MSRLGRPSGIVLVVLMQAFIGFSSLAEGVVLLAGFLPAAGLPPGMPAGAVTITASVASVIGVIGLCLTWGVWTGKGWAWTSTFAYALISILVSVAYVPLSIPQMFIDALILYYLTRPEVKAYCRKGPPVGLPVRWEEVRLPSGTYPRGLPQPQVRCRHCGTPNLPEATYCQECGSILK